MFVGLLGLTMTVCVVLEVFFLPATPNAPPYSREHTFITVESGDGRRLGNIMFSYAALIGIAHKHNMTPAMPASKAFPLPSFLQTRAVLTQDIPNLLGAYTNYEEYGRRACAYDMGLEAIPYRPTRLWGYFQSWKYFEHSEKAVRDEFQLQPAVKQSAEEYISREVLGSRGRQGVVLVGIHVRRGDITLDYFRNYGYTTPEKDYYQRAVERMHKDFGDNIHFIVCSDGIDWAKENLKDLDPHIHFSEGRKDYEDLAILSLCDHTIVSVGSFGWWAGWLAGGTVVYYAKWPREFSKLEYHVTKHHYFLPTWIPIR